MRIKRVDKDKIISFEEYKKKLRSNSGNRPLIDVSLGFNPLPYPLFIWKFFAYLEPCFIELLYVFANRFTVTLFRHRNPGYTLS